MIRRFTPCQAAEYSRVLASENSSGKKLVNIADLVIDNCALSSDSMIEVLRIDVKVGLSTNHRT